MTVCISESGGLKPYAAVVLICTRFRKRPTPGAQRRPLVDGVRESEARLEAVLRRLGEAVRQVVIEALQVRERREGRERLGARPAAGQDDAVEAIAADDEAAARSMTGAVAAL